MLVAEHRAVDPLGLAVALQRPVQIAFLLEYAADVADATGDVRMFVAQRRADDPLGGSRRGQGVVETCPVSKVDTKLVGKKGGVGNVAERFGVRQGRLRVGGVGVLAGPVAVVLRVIETIREQANERGQRGAPPVLVELDADDLLHQAVDRNGPGVADDRNVGEQFELVFHCLLRLVARVEEQVKRDRVGMAVCRQRQQLHRRRVRWRRSSSSAAVTLGRLRRYEAARASASA